MNHGNVPISTAIKKRKPTVLYLSEGGRRNRVIKQHWPLRVQFTCCISLTLNHRDNNSGFGAGDKWFVYVCACACVSVCVCPCLIHKSENKWRGSELDKQARRTHTHTITHTIKNTPATTNLCCVTDEIVTEIAVFQLRSTLFHQAAE